jgi:hypothetical protein
MCSDLRRSYHDDWLVDIVQIIYYCVCHYSAEDMALVQKAGGLIEDFALLQDEDEGEEEEEEEDERGMNTV